MTLQDVNSSDDPEISGPIVEYMHNVCEALSEYVLAGGLVQIESARSGAPLTMTFTLDDGDHYHSLLRARMAGARQVRLGNESDLTLESYVEARTARDWLGEFFTRGKAVPTN